MIDSDAALETTQAYIQKVQEVLLTLRRSHSPAEYAVMSKAYLAELTKAQRAVALYLATPPVEVK